MEEVQSKNNIIDDHILPITFDNNYDNNNNALTKTALKRQKKQALYDANKTHRKKLEKEKKKENNRKKQEEYNKNKIINNDNVNNELIEYTPTITPEERKNRKMKENEEYLIKCSNNFAVIIDLQWEKDHKERPLKSLSQQILFCHGINKRATYPANIYLTSLNEDSELRTKFTKLSMENWLGITSSSLDYINLPMFCPSKPTVILDDQLNDSNLNNIINNKKQLVYLTSDADETLETLDDNCAYIIGGIVDRNAMKGITYNKACLQNIRSAKLPIKENFPITATHVLTVNHVFDILLNYKKFGNWKEALYAVLPLKKSESKINKKRVREYNSDNYEVDDDDDNNNNNNNNNKDDEDRDHEDNNNNDVLQNNLKFID